MKLSLAGFIICVIIIILVIVLNSCAVCPNGGGPVDYKRVQRHDSRPFRASVVLKDNGTIAKANEYRRTTLISVTRTMRGFKHVFIADEGDTAVIYLYPRLTVDSCYLVKTINFS